MQGLYTHGTLHILPIKHEQDPSIFRLLDQDFQMSHHSKYSAVLPFHVRGRSLIQFEIEFSKKMRECEIELAICQTSKVSPAARIMALRRLDAVSREKGQTETLRDQR